MATKEAIAATPKEVRVGPFRYTVSFDGEAAYDYDFAGVCLYRSRRLKLDPRQSDTEIPQTFLHELLHAVGNAYGIEMFDRHTTDDKGHVTDKIDLTASALLQLLRDNPAVVGWLTKTR